MGKAERKSEQETQREFSFSLLNFPPFPLSELPLEQAILPEGATAGPNLQLTPFLSHKALQDGHTQFRASLDQAEDDIMMLRKLDRQIKSYNVSINP